MFVYCECRVLSGRGLCDELITRPEESYRLCCVVVCDLETPRMGAPYIYDISRLRFNVHGPVHLNNILIYIQQDATLHSLLSVTCSTCFGWYLHPSSGAQTTVSTASGICHTVTAICCYSGRVGTGLSVQCFVVGGVRHLQHNSPKLLPASAGSNLGEI